MPDLTVFVPALFSELGGADVDTGARDAWPATRNLLARAAVTPMPHESVEHALLALFVRAPDEVPAAVPAAALTAPFDAVTTSSCVRMRADPVHLRAEPNQILLFNGAGIMPTAQEADELLAVLNSGFDDCRFFRGRDPARWYTDVETPARTHSPFAANGRSMSKFLPAGDGARTLQQRMNDAQMLLHEHPVNTARAERGLPAINSIWLWGAGDVPGRLGGPVFVGGNDAFGAALALQAGCEWCADMTADAAIGACAAGASGLIVIGAPGGVAGPCDDACGVAAFEHAWAVPLLSALRRRTLRRLTLITDRHVYTTTPIDRFKFWRRERAAPESHA